MQTIEISFCFGILVENGVKKRLAPSSFSISNCWILKLPSRPLKDLNHLHKKNIMTFHQIKLLQSLISTISLSKYSNNSMVFLNVKWFGGFARYWFFFLQSLVYGFLTSWLDFEIIEITWLWYRLYLMITTITRERLSRHHSWRQECVPSPERAPILQRSTFLACSLRCGGRGRWRGRYWQGSSRQPLGYHIHRHFNSLCGLKNGFSHCT